MTRFDRAFLALWLALATVAVGLSCQQPQQPSPPPVVNINISQVVTQTIEAGLQPGQQPQAAAAGCLPVVRLGIQIPMTIAAGQNTSLDATPHSDSQPGNGVGQRSDACNLASGIDWTAGPANICSVSPLSGDFTPAFRAIEAGTCAITACVDGICAAGFVTVTSAGTSALPEPIEESWLHWLGLP